MLLQRSLSVLSAASSLCPNLNLIHYIVVMLRILSLLANKKSSEKFQTTFV